MLQTNKLLKTKHAQNSPDARFAVSTHVSHTRDFFPFCSSFAIASARSSTRLPLKRNSAFRICVATQNVYFRFAVIQADFPFPIRFGATWTASDYTAKCSANDSLRVADDRGARVGYKKKAGAQSQVPAAPCAADFSYGESSQTVPASYFPQLSLTP